MATNETGLEVVGLDHLQVAIPAGGEEQARGFYVALLGLEEVPKPARMSSGGLWLRGPGVALHLGVEEDFRAARKAHPALLVSDLDVAWRTLVAAGIDAAEPDDRPGRRRFFVADPFGNRLELMQG